MSDSESPAPAVAATVAVSVKDADAAVAAPPRSSIAELLARTEALAGDRGLAEAAARLFEFSQFLLDDDDNLTKVGNLNGEARKKVRARTLELLGVDPEEENTDLADLSGGDDQPSPAATDAKKTAGKTTVAP